MLASPVGASPTPQAAHEDSISLAYVNGTWKCFSFTIGDHSAQVEDSDHCEVIKRTERDETVS